MKYPIYSYRDLKVAFGQPIVEMNDQTAIRGFAYAINQNQGLMNFSPKDYDLYRIGEFDAEKGILIPEKVPVLVMSGVSAVEV